jgi:hypothetical protein
MATSSDGEASHCRLSEAFEEALKLAASMATPQVATHWVGREVPPDPAHPLRSPHLTPRRFLDPRERDPIALELRADARERLRDTRRAWRGTSSGGARAH